MTRYDCVQFLDPRVYGEHGPIVISEIDVKGLSEEEIEDKIERALKILGHHLKPVLIAEGAAVTQPSEMEKVPAKNPVDDRPLYELTREELDELSVEELEERTDDDVFLFLLTRALASET